MTSNLDRRALEAAWLAGDRALAEFAPEFGKITRTALMQTVVDAAIPAYLTALSTRTKEIEEEIAARVTSTISYVHDLYLTEIKARTRRIDDLLEANNRYLQRARDAEAELKELRWMMEGLRK